MTTRIEAPARLRPRHQIAVPAPIVEALGARPNDTLLFETDATEPGVVRVRVRPRRFAGTFTGVYGTTDDVRNFLRREHSAWD